MDVVYICREGANEELRYSLRSLVNIEHDRVWVFGGAPLWYDNGRHVRVPQTGTKQENAKRNLLAACMHSRVSETFLLMNDDFYITEPAEPRLYDRGPSREVIAEYEAAHPNSTYTVALRDTHRLVESLGYNDPLSYELHVPMPVRKDVMLEALMLIIGDGRMYLNHRTIYGALAGEPSVTIPDPKLYTAAQPLPDGPYLSSFDQGFHIVRPLLERLLPDPCRYEATVPAVVRRKDDIMYVSPARIIRKGVLIAYAGEVMTEAEARRRGLEVEHPAEPEAVPEPAPDYDAMNVRELRELADSRGISAPKRANRADLLGLLR